jgi:hypothetical protein
VASVISSATITAPAIPAHAVSTMHIGPIVHAVDLDVSLGWGHLRRWRRRVWGFENAGLHRCGRSRLILDIQSGFEIRASSFTNYIKHPAKPFLFNRQVLLFYKSRLDFFPYVQLV